MAGTHVQEFTSQNWDKEVLHSDTPVLVDFWAPWCGPCRQLAPIVDRIAEQFAGKIKVGKLNIDDAQEIAVQHNIASIPRLFLFKNGKPLPEQQVGLQGEAVLVQWINRALAS